MTELSQAIEAVKAAPKVNIKGKQYTQVAARVEVFREHFGHEYGLETEMVSGSGAEVVFRAVIRDSAGRVVATGWAEENRQSGQINRTSAVENCETSAIGRALANFGLHGGEYATAEEVDHAIKQQQTISKSELKRKYSELWHQMEGCSDEDELVALLNSDEAIRILEKMERYLPNDFYGDGKDIKGWNQRVKERRADMQDKQLNMAAGAQA